MGDTLQDIKNRRSIKEYEARQVSEADLDVILEAGTWAACGQAAQAARMVAVQNRAVIDEVERLNAAVLGKPDAKTFYGAPTLVVVFADTNWNTWQDDGNLVIANLMLAAEALGIGSCYVYRARESFESEKGRALAKQWGLSDSYKGVGNVLLGYGATKPEPKPRKADFIIKIK